MKFYEELEELKKVKEKCSSEARHLEEEKQSELERTKSEIIEKYANLTKSKYAELMEHIDRVDSYCKMVAEYSFFNINDIGKIIASLIRTFEGVNYIYQDAYYDKTEVKNLAFDKEETKVRGSIRMVIAEDCKAKIYSDDIVYEIIKNGKGIVLSTTDTVDNQIPFYEQSLGTHTLKEKIKFGRFAYLKEFIDNVISYKMENKNKNISYEELEKLEIDFVTAHVKEIEENYRVVEEKQEAQMKQRLATDKENRERTLGRILKKKEEN